MARTLIMLAALVVFATAQIPPTHVVVGVVTSVYERHDRVLAEGTGQWCLELRVHAVEKGRGISPGSMLYVIDPRVGVEPPLAGRRLRLACVRERPGRYEVLRFTDAPYRPERITDASLARVRKLLAAWYERTKSSKIRLAPAADDPERRLRASAPVEELQRLYEDRERLIVDDLGPAFAGRLLMDLDPALFGKLLTRDLKSEDANVRGFAASTFGWAGVRAAIPSLKPLLSDAVAEVRLRAALSLGALRCPDAVPELVRYARREKHWTANVLSAFRRLCPGVDHGDDLDAWCAHLEAQGWLK